MNDLTNDKKIVDYIILKFQFYKINFDKINITYIQVYLESVNQR